MKTTTTTLDSLAAQFNLYRADNLPETHKGGEYCTGKVERAEMDFKDMAPAISFIQSQSDIQSGIYFNCREQFKSLTGEHELYYIENSYYLVLVPGCQYILMLRGNDYRNKGKYYLFPYWDYQRNWHNIDNYKRSKALDGLNEPNRVGAFTRSKFDAWAKYCEEYVNRLIGLKDFHGNEQRKLREEMQSIIESMPGAQVQMGKDGNWVSISTPLFRVVLDLHTESNYLSKKIEFNGTISDVARIHSLVYIPVEV